MNLGNFKELSIDGVSLKELKANGTLIWHSGPSKNNLYGVWVVDTYSLREPTWYIVPVNFTIGGYACTELKHRDGTKWSMVATTTDGGTIQLVSGSSWVFNSPVFDFGTKGQVVYEGFFDWLNANATYQEE